MKIPSPSLGGALLLGSTRPAGGFHIAPPRCARPRTQISAAAPDEGDLAALPLPPTKGQNAYRNIRDTFSYLSDPDRFIRTRSEELGPIFLTYQFFKPCVIVGGREAVKEFVTGKELKQGVIYPTLPQAFVNLHTKWGSLNLDSNDRLFKETRLLFADVLQSETARGVYSEVLYAEVEAYVRGLADRVEEEPERAIYLMPELKSFFLQVFSKVISGKGLTAEQEQMFIDYNTALLSLSVSSKQYKKGFTALTELKAEMLERFKEAGESEESTGRWYHDQLAGRQGFEDEDRIASGMVLFIWGAYVECADLAVNALAQMAQCPDLLTDVRNEMAAAEGGEASISPTDHRYWNRFDFTLGLLRETLRRIPPGAGVPRHGLSDFSLAGYRIPSGTPVMMDPRVGNGDPSLFPEPERFEPLRWVPADAAPSGRCPFAGSALGGGPGSWFPGGFGAHQCPGIPIAEMAGKMIVAKMASEFGGWEFSGEGLTRDGGIKYVNLPIKCPVDEFGMKFELVK